MTETAGTDKLMLEGRKRLSMTGVTSVDGFSENYLKLTVGSDKVTVNGQGIKITSYNKSNGNFTADGDFVEIKYGVKKQPVMKRLFK